MSSSSATSESNERSRSEKIKAHETARRTVSKKVSYELEAHGVGINAVDERTNLADNMKEKIRKTESFKAIRTEFLNEADIPKSDYKDVKGIRRERVRAWLGLPNGDGEKTSKMKLAPAAAGKVLFKIGPLDSRDLLRWCKKKPMGKEFVAGEYHDIEDYLMQKALARMTETGETF